MNDPNALALFGVIGVGMSTSAALLVRSVYVALRRPGRKHQNPAACSC
jgi:hypothetical protein